MSLPEDMEGPTKGKLLVNVKTKISLQCPSLLVFYSFLDHIEKEVKWEAQMGTGCLPVVQQGVMTITRTNEVLH